jgi:imidazolonepropionase-like amidohydrolase
MPTNQARRKSTFLTVARRGLALASLAACASAGAGAQSAAGRTALAPGVVAITGATVVTMTRDSVLRDATVLVRDGRIAAVGPAARVQVPAGARRIDGRGKFVVPGLADMHAHLYADEWVADSVAPAELGVMLAHGVTTARLMIGTAVHRDLRRRIERGALVGPQLYIASPQVSGDSAVNTYVVRSPEEARRAVGLAAHSGYDFVKLTTNITPEIYDALVAAAAERRIPLVGHVDPRVGVARALGARQQIEHLDNYMESVLADSAPSRASVSDVGAYRAANWATLDHVDDRKVEAIAGATARAGVHVTPTLAFFHLWFATEQSDSVVRARPDYAHIPARMRTLYERARSRYWQTPPSATRRARYVAVRNRLVRAIVDSGGHVMAGSDAPGGLMGYGWTMHRELEMLVAAGLTPWQALAAATTVPARWLGAEREWGSIAPGRRADLVLLDADPLRDIRNTTRIAAVLIGGRVLERPMLDESIERARRLLNP